MDELLKQLDIRGLSWRNLLLAGALPALLLVVCLLAYESGWQGCQGLISDLANFNTRWEANSRTIGSFLILWAIFVTARAPIFAVYRRVPIPVLRTWLLRRYAKKRDAARLAKDRALWRISVARWYDHDFDPHAFVAEAVRAEIKVPSKASFEEASALGRSQVSADGRFGWWRRRKLHRTLGLLYVMIGIRDEVSRLAAEFAKKIPGRHDEENWSHAEQSLALKAPGDWVYQELSVWRDLYSNDNRARIRIESLDSDELTDAYARASRRSELFPFTKWVEPSGLGNTMAALEDYSVQRYGIDTSLLWSRIENVLPKEQRDSVYTSQVAVYALLNTSAALLIAGAICLARLFSRISGLKHDLIQHVTTILAAFFLSWIFSRFAVYVAGQLRYQIESRVDLYAPRWLAALGLVPKDIAERQQMIRAVGEFVNGAKPQMPNFPLHAIDDPVLSFDKTK